MGGAMLRDFAIVATAFGVKLEQFTKTGLSGVISLLLGVLFLAIGTLTSALVKNQIVAAVFAFALLLVVFSLGLVENLVSGGVLKEALGYMNLW